MENLPNVYNIQIELCAKEKYSWNVLTYLIKNQRFPLSRSYEQEYYYQMTREMIKERWVSVHDYVLYSKFGYTKVTVNLNTLDNVGKLNQLNDSRGHNLVVALEHDSHIPIPPPGMKYKAIKYKGYTNDPKIVLVENDFPYFLEDNIYHLILWKLHSNIGDKDIGWAKHEAQLLLFKKGVKGTVVNILHWINPDYLKSLPEIDHVHLVCFVSKCPIDKEIHDLVLKRTELRKSRNWAMADEIKDLLSKEPYTVELSDLSDGTTAWEKKENIYKPKHFRIVWSDFQTISYENHIDQSQKQSDIPLFIATVDKPHYQSRLKETRAHLSHTTSEGLIFNPIQTVNLFDLDKHPHLGARRILYEGWRQILLPHILTLYDNKSDEYSDFPDKFVLVAEDDIRLPPEVTPDLIRSVCMDAFRSKTDVDILSLGHASTALSSNKKNRSSSARLLDHLDRGGGVHGTTLLAIRAPEGLRNLLHALNSVTQAGKRTHLDQFLFHSPLHNVSIAISCPPLVGWCESEITLTSVGPGCRRNGGGRLAKLPTVNMTKEIKIDWVYRRME